MGNHISKQISRQKRLANIQYKNERERAFIQTLADRKPSNQSWKQLVDTLYWGTVTEEKLVSDAYVQLHQLFKKFTANKRVEKKKFREVLIHVQQQKCHKLLQDARYLIALFALSNHASAMVRAIKEWKRPSYSVEKQFISLVSHCFARYEVPLFFYQVWFDEKKSTQQQWFIDIGSGKSIRCARGLPVRMTKKMAHIFLQAPEALTVEEALRWAQARSMGGGDRVAQAIAVSPLSRNEFREEVFWETVIRFFAQQPDEHAARVGEVIDYIAAVYRQNRDFTMKGRTWNALWRQTEAWHEQLNRERKLGGRYVWERSGIGEREVKKGSRNKTKTYTLVELCSSKELATEGRKMRHCVSSYAHVCFKQRCAIFSLRVYEQGIAEETTLATIEVDLKQRRIVQAKARFNARISATAQQMMEKWATEEGLTISPWL
ncbi:MAG: PcfJ domain-containing protein [Cyclobacteriaceae bacterium]